jgi:hypothetical protein
MPRIDTSMLKGLGGAEITHSERYVGEEKLEVTVLNEYGAFDEFIDGLHEAIASKWEMYHHGASFPVTQDTFRRYAYTAVAARVARTRNERFHIRCDDAWALPAPLAAILAGIGRVTLEAPVLTLVPAVDREVQQQSLSYDEWARVSRQLRAIESDPNCKFVFAHAIEGSKEGDEALMSLIPVTDDAGRLIELQQRYEIHPISAAAFLILGLAPEGMTGRETRTVHPLLRSPHFIRIAGVKAFLHRFYDAAAG